MPTQHTTALPPPTAFRASPGLLLAAALALSLTLSLVAGCQPRADVSDAVVPASSAVAGVAGEGDPAAGAAANDAANAQAATSPGADPSAPGRTRGPLDWFRDWRTWLAAAVVAGLAYLLRQAPMVDGEDGTRRAWPQWLDPRTLTRRFSGQPPAANGSGADAPDETVVEPRPPAAVVQPAADPWHVVPVYFGTDRKRAPKSDDRRFSDEPNEGRMDLGIIEVTVPPANAHEIGEVERPSIWRFEFKEDPSKHFTIASVEHLDQASFKARLRAKVSAATEPEGKEGLLFIHGYNVSFDAAAYRTAQIAFDLGFVGPALMWSWPSAAKTSSYPSDETNVTWTEPHLEAFLRLVAGEMGLTHLHVIAHSMGNRALTRVLADLEHDPLPAGAAALRNVVLAAPDIDARVFGQLAARFQGACERTTLYASSGDKALKASRKVHTHPRAGESGDAMLLVPKVDTIDASAVDTSFLGHSYYGNSREVINDLYYLLCRDLPPAKRHGLEGKQKDGTPYWAFRA